MTDPFSNVFKNEQEQDSPFSDYFTEEQKEDESPFAKQFLQDTDEIAEKPKDEPGFFQRFLDKLKPKPFKEKIEFITDEEFDKLSDPEQRKKLSLTEKKQLVDQMNLQREFEQGIAASRGLSFGASRAMEPEVEFKLLDPGAQKVQENVGSLVSFIATLGPITKGVSLVLPRVAPFITRMIGAGSTAALQDFGNQFFDPEKEVDPIEISKTFGKMAVLDGALQAVGKGIEFARDINRISKVFNVNRGKAFKFVWDEAGNRGLGMGEFAEDAAKWAELAEDLAKSAEEGRITLEVPGEEVVGKPIAELEGPIIEAEVTPIEPIEQQIEGAESRLAKVNKDINFLKDQKQQQVKKLFHGTQKDFKKFEKTEDIGFHFSEDIETAKEFADETNKTGRIIKAYINIQNPLEIKDLGGWSPPFLAEELDNMGLKPVNWDSFQAITDKFIGTDLYEGPKETRPTREQAFQNSFQEIRNELKNLGYDSLTYINEYEGKRKRAYIVFDANDIYTDKEIRDLETDKDFAPHQWEKRRLEQELADLEARNKITEVPEGIAEDLSKDVVDPDPTTFSQEEDFIFNNSEVEGVFQNALLKDGFAKEIDSAWNKLGLNVERPFINIGAPETGFQVKNYYSTLSKKEEQTVAAIRKIGHFDKSTRSQIALLAEKATPPEDSTLRKAYDDVRKFFDDTFQELKEANVLTSPFPESYIKRLESENLLLKQRISQKVGNSKDHLQQIKENNDLIKDLKQAKFVSIPARLWFEKNFDLNRPMTQRTVKILNQRKRKSPTIQSLIDEDLVSPDDVDIAEIMAYYGRRAARDIGLGKILTAAESEGLASRKPKPGFVQLPVYQYPAIKDFHIHPKFAEWLTTYANPRYVGMFGRISSKVKGFTFYNPMILPFNDLVQQIMATQGTGIKYWAQAMKDVRLKTPEFWEAYENGLFSQPYNMFRDDFERQWTRSLVENKTAPKRLKQFFLEDKVINSVYNASSCIAWSADRVIRMATYRNLLSRGMNPREAAQTAALFHGDYSKVHPNTRKMLNNIFYTPSFKIVMGKLYYEMLKSPFKIGKAILAGEEIPKGEKAKFLSGLLGTLGVVIALDQLMTNGFGFAREQFGRKYSKNVEDDEGVDRNLVVNFSNPATLPFKFYWRLIESFSPSNQTALKNLLTKNKFELNPMIQIATKLVKNEDSHGNPIYENFGDDSLTKLAKASKFVTKEILPFLRRLSDEPFEDREARNKYREEVGLIFNALPGSFVYWGPDSEQQKARKISQANSEFLRKAKRLAEKGESITEGELQKHQKLLERLTKD